MRAFVRVAAYIAVVGQLAVLLGTLAEGRDGIGMASHVEQLGTSIHYAHSDVCALCQARSLQSLSAQGPAMLPDGPGEGVPFAAVAERPVIVELHLPNPSRAPPARLS
jgi:hypothetical protein